MLALCLAIALAAAEIVSFAQTPAEAPPKPNDLHREVLVDVINNPAPRGFVPAKMNPSSAVGDICQPPGGNYWFSLVVSAEGNLLDARPLTGKGLAIQECVTKQVSHYTFKPATLKGQPVAVKMLVQFQFAEHWSR